MVDQVHAFLEVQIGEDFGWERSRLSVRREISRSGEAVEALRWLGARREEYWTYFTDEQQRQRRWIGRNTASYFSADAQAAGARLS